AVALFELEAERGQLGAGRGVIGVVNAMDAEGFGNLDEHEPVVEIGNLFGRNLGNVQGDTVDVLVGLAHVDEAGRDEKVDEALELEHLDATLVEFAAFVVDHGNLQFVPSLEGADKVDHFGKRLGLC